MCPTFWQRFGLTDFPHCVVEQTGRESARVWGRNEAKFGTKLWDLLQTGGLCLLYGGRLQNAILPMRIWLPEVASYIGLKEF